MKISDYRSDYYAFTGKASEIVRQLALAGIAVVWLLKGTAPVLPNAQAVAPLAEIRLPLGLLLPSIGFLVALACDLAQYVVAAIIWRHYYRELESRELPDDAGDQEEHDFGLHDTKMEKPILWFFWAKIGFASVAWCFLVGMLVARVFA